MMEENNSVEGNDIMIQSAKKKDAHVMLDIMRQAFLRYKNDPFPSSALEETVQSIQDAMEKGEKAFIYYVDLTPVGIVRFRMEEKSLYFYRLSVIPEMQGKGIAKQLLSKLENVAQQAGMSKIHCKVRKSEENNIRLYESVGFEIVGQDAVLKKNGTLEIVLMEKLLSAH